MTRLTNHAKIPKHQREGYILVTVVILIAIVGIMAAGIANRGLKVALETVQAKEKLQRRWGSYSCRRTLLNNADTLLGRATEETNEKEDPQADTETTTEDETTDDESQKPPKRFCNMYFTLGGLSFEVMVADENAKINLNVVYAYQGKSGVLSALEKHNTSSGDIHCRLRPYRVSNRQGQYPAFDSWGQVYDMANGDRTEAITTLQKTSENITCWGNQRLNFHAATDEALFQICKMFVSSTVAKKLVDFRSQNPSCEIDDALDKLGLSEREYHKLEGVLCDKSTCWSLWIHCRPAEQGVSSWDQFCHDHYEFGIIEKVETSEGHIQQFVW